MTILFPLSAIPVSSFVYPLVYVGGGGNSKEEAGLGLTDATTMDADAIWRLRFMMPPTLPSGTAKCRTLSLANAATGVLKPHIKWVSVAVGEDASSASLNNEGVGTITWSTGDEDKYLETLVTLDADTIVANEMVVMDLVFEDTSMTLAVESCHHVMMIWEL